MTSPAPNPTGLPAAGAQQGGHDAHTALISETVLELPEPVAVPATQRHFLPIPKGIPAHASCAVVIDLEAIGTNFRALRMLAGRSECAGVVKADAYGLGLEPVLRVLLAEGCRVFFVANIDEAWRVRQQAPKAIIYVLNGVYSGTAPAFAELKARPVLGSAAEIDEWAAACRQAGQRWPAAVHVDTGMNRLGLTVRDLQAAQSRQAFASFDVSLVMSHLANADSPGSAMNARQRQQFDSVRAAFPNVPASLANSAGTMLGPAFHYDMVRPGIALYGGRAMKSVQNPMKPVVRLLARIIQVREIAAGESVGYGQTFQASRPSRIAIVAAGYADGLPRGMTNGSVTMALGVPLSLAESVRPGVGSMAHIQGYPVPIVGRVSMDLIAVDTTDMPASKLVRGDFAEIMGSATTVDDIAALSETIGYEVLTRLSRRAHRVYLGKSE